jgi:4-hydroxythreonine-4-phosphate dehydrogenase
MKKIRIALTMGDPAGIGPELALKAVSLFAEQKNMEIILYGSEDIFLKTSQLLKIQFDKAHTEIVNTGNLKFSEIKKAENSPECGTAALEAVKKAALDTINGKTDAVVTCPVSKAAINMAGIDFTGHTEYIAELCSCRNFAMMQSSGNLRVAFVTTHIPLKSVSETITEKRIISVTEMLNDAIKEESISSPLIGIAAINPHAGENGYMGTEDEETVKPAVAELQKKGLAVEGPFPSDTLFIPGTLNRFNGIVSMYHDQGHIPFKMLAFDKGVNSTLGLPIIRTSVDHGTAFNIAYKNQADTGSLYAALSLAFKRAAYKSEK